MFYSDCIVPKQCIVFLSVITMAKQALLFDSHYMAFKTIQLELANKKPLTTKPTITQIEISCYKCIIFYATKLCTTHGKCCSLCRKSYETGS